MSKNRVEAFSDGVIAIIITIMVLELKAPEEATFEALMGLLPVFLSYVLSFIYVALFWNNHHHLMHTVNHIRTSILWANIHLLFWLSLIPFATAWAGENHFASLPVAVYGLVFFLASLAYYILNVTIVHTHGNDSILARALGNNYKGKVSVVLNAAAIPLAFVNSWIAMSILFGLVIFWLIPDQNIEKELLKSSDSKEQ